MTSAKEVHVTKLDNFELSSFSQSYSSIVNARPNYFIRGEESASETVMDLTHFFPVHGRDQFDVVAFPAIAFGNPEQQQEIINAAQKLGIKTWTDDPIDPSLKVMDLSSMWDESETVSMVAFSIPLKDDLIKLQAESGVIQAEFKNEVLTNLLKSFNKAEIIGEGHSSIVAKITDASGKTTALKVFNSTLLSREVATAQRDKEIDVLNKLKGGPFPTVDEKLVGAIAINYVYLPMSYIPGKNLHESVNRLKPSTEGMLQKVINKLPGRHPNFVSIILPLIMKSAKQAVEFAHSSGIALFDLQSPNWQANWGKSLNQQISIGFPLTFLDLGSAVALSPETEAEDNIKLTQLSEELIRIYTIS